MRIQAIKTIKVSQNKFSQAGTEQISINPANIEFITKTNILTTNSKEKTVYELHFISGMSVFCDKSDMAIVGKSFK